MKKYFPILLLTVLFISCELTTSSIQTDEPEIPVLIENLAGTWNWILTIDSTNQVVDVPTLNDRRSIIITTDFTLRRYRNDTLTFHDTFNLYKTVLPNTNDTVSVIDWKTSRDFNYIVYSLKSKTMVVRYRSHNKIIYLRVD